MEISRWKTVSLLVAANLVVFLAAALAIEAAGRFFSRSKPSYDVLFTQPDRGVGWKHVPSLRFIWTGTQVRAPAFSVPIEINSRGFRDAERILEKPPGTVRIAFLGDSLVEALQVPLELTAAMRLETRLMSAPARPTRFEVLNFGVSNYSVGQFLLMWHVYARHYRPDYVVALVAPTQMRRTTRSYASGRFASSAGRALAIRPTFRLEGQNLITVPAADFDEFVAQQVEVLRTDFGGKRIRSRSPGVLAHVFGNLATRLRAALAPTPPPPSPELKASLERAQHKARQRSLWIKQRNKLQSPGLPLNRAILYHLDSLVRQAGGRFAIADASRYLDRDSRTEVRLRHFCAEAGLAVIPLSQKLAQERARGVHLQWKHDRHFNRHGNQVFADAVHEWLVGEGVVTAKVATD